MRIPLSSFEQHIDETILERGLSYFESGAVGEVEQISPGEFEAEVMGTEPYAVRINVQQDSVVKGACDCPFDGPVCKHVVAVLFHLQQEVLDVKVKRKRSKKEGHGSAKKKPTTVLEKVADLMDSMAHEELKDFILAQSSRDQDFRRIFLDEHEERKGGGTHASYAKRIRSIINGNGGRGRANGWHAARPVSHALRPLLEKLDGYMRSGSQQLALPLATALLHELGEAMSHIDDSGGHLGGDIAGALHVLRGISEKPQDERIRKALMEFALAGVKEGHYSGWDWHTDLMGICTRLVRDEAEAVPVYEALQREQRSSYSEAHARLNQLELLRRLRGDAEAEAFMNAHLGISEMRTRAIELAIARDQLDRASELADEGYSKDHKSLPGLAAQWARTQLRIAELRGDKSAVARIARQLILDANDAEKNMRKLEKAVGVCAWPDEEERLLQALLKHVGWQQRSIAAGMLHDRQRWKELLEFCATKEGGQEFSTYAEVLGKHFPKKIAAVYMASAEKQLTNWNLTRSVYRDACTLLRKVRDLDEHELVAAKAQEWRSAFAKRPAMLEELALALDEAPPAKKQKAPKPLVLGRW